MGDSGSIGNGPFFLVKCENAAKNRVVNTVHTHPNLKSFPYTWLYTSHTRLRKWFLKKIAF